MEKDEQMNNEKPIEQDVFLLGAWLDGHRQCEPDSPDCEMLSTDHIIEMLDDMVELDQQMVNDALIGRGYTPVLDERGKLKWCLCRKPDFTQLEDRSHA